MLSPHQLESCNFHSSYKEVSLHYLGMTGMGLRRPNLLLSAGFACVGWQDSTRSCLAKSKVFRQLLKGCICYVRKAKISCVMLLSALPSCCLSCAGGQGMKGPLGVQTSATLLWSLPVCDCRALNF